MGLRKAGREAGVAGVQDEAFRWLMRVEKKGAGPAPVGRGDSAF